ncbi:MAG: LysM peptidoglycan-binding domain-containing protein [Actinomycetota bacterium]
MAQRSEDVSRSGRVYRFPIERARARARVTRRRARFRRTVAGTALLTVVVGTLAGGLARGADVPTHSRRVVVVRSGATLWDIASRHAPEGTDVRSYVDALVAANGLSGAVIQAGMRLRLPR